MKSKIAVVGNRQGFDYEYVREKLIANKITKDCIIISGGAEGVDTYAQKFAKEIGAEIRIFYPDPDLPHPWRYLERDRRMVDEANLVIAFNKLDKGGTFYTINYAAKIGRPYIEDMGYYPSKTIEPKTIKEEKISQSITKGEQSEIKT